MTGEPGWAWLVLAAGAAALLLSMAVAVLLGALSLHPEAARVLIVGLTSAASTALGTWAGYRHGHSR